MVTHIHYKIVSFVYMISNLASLALAVIGTVSFFLGNYQEFVQKKSMLQRLYGE